DRQDEWDQRHHRRGVKRHQIRLDADAQRAHAREQQTERRADDQRQHEAGEKQFTGVEKLLDELAARDELPQPHQRLAERHHEGPAGRAACDLPQREADEDAEPERRVAAKGVVQDSVFQNLKRYEFTSGRDTAEFSVFTSEAKQSRAANSDWIASSATPPRNE